MVVYVSACLLLLLNKEYIFTCALSGTLIPTSPKKPPFASLFCIAGWKKSSLIFGLFRKLLNHSLASFPQSIPYVF